MKPLNNPYHRFEPERLILRDELAIDRTVLANERTVLAYVRTALALILAGVTFIHFSNAIWFSVVGYICLVIGSILIIIGWIRFRRMERILSLIRANHSNLANPSPQIDPQPSHD